MALMPRENCTPYSWPIIICGRRTVQPTERAQRWLFFLQVTKILPVPFAFIRISLFDNSRAPEREILTLCTIEILRLVHSIS